MGEFKRITLEDIQDLVKRTHFNERLLTKDYFLTWLLSVLKDIKNIYFKGGTAIQKTILSHARLSEDIDFTVTKDLQEVEKNILTLLEKQEFISKIEKDKSVDKFVRLVIHYKNMRDQDDTIFIDLNERAKLLLTPEKLRIQHFYNDFIPEFSFHCLNKKEMIAEKMAATIGRNKPRDHFDLYKILKAGYGIDLNLVKKKCEQSGDEFNIIKMFNQAKKLKNRWDTDMVALLPEEITFQEVITTLAQHFRLKDEKDALKDKNS